MSFLKEIRTHLHAFDSSAKSEIEAFIKHIEEVYKEYNVSAMDPHGQAKPVVFPQTAVTPAAAPAAVTPAAAPAAVTPAADPTTPTAAVSN